MTGCFGMKVVLFLLIYTVAAVSGQVFVKAFWGSRNPVGTEGEKD